MMLSKKYLDSNDSNNNMVSIFLFFRLILLFNNLKSMD